MISLARERKGIDEQLEIIDGKIEKAVEKLKMLKAQRQELLNKKEGEALKDIYAILQEKGISATQAADILRNTNI